MEYPTEIYLLIFDQNTYTCNETIQKTTSISKNVGKYAAIKRTKIVKVLKSGYFLSSSLKTGTIF